MSECKYSHFLVRGNKDVADVSFIYFYDNNIEDSEKQDIFTNIKFEGMIPSI